MPTSGQIAGGFLDGGREPLSRRVRLVVLATVIVTFPEEDREVFCALIHINSVEMLQRA